MAVCVKSIVPWDRRWKTTVRKLIEAHGLTQAAAASRFMVDQPVLILVRHAGPADGSCRVCPGGASLEEESLGDTVIREAREETGVTGRPVTPLIIEDLTASESRMYKIRILSGASWSRSSELRALGMRASPNRGSFGGAASP